MRSQRFLSGEDEKVPRGPREVGGSGARAGQYGGRALQGVRQEIRYESRGVVKRSLSEGLFDFQYYRRSGHVLRTTRRNARSGFEEARDPRAASQDRGSAESDEAAIAAEPNDAEEPREGSVRRFQRSEKDADDDASRAYKSRQVHSSSGNHASASACACRFIGSHVVSAS